MRDFQLSGFLYILILAIIALSTNQCGNGTDTKIPPRKKDTNPISLLNSPMIFMLIKELTVNIVTIRKLMEKRQEFLQKRSV